MMRYKSSRYMRRRQRSAGRAFARALLWFTAGVLALVGTAMLAAAPLAEFAAGRILAARDLGPARLDVVRLGATGISVRDLELLGGAVRVGEIDLAYDWRGLMQRRLEALRVAGVAVAVDWRADGTVAIGPRQIYPAPAASDPRPTSPPPAPGPQPAAPRIGTLSLEGAVLTLNLPDGPLPVTAAGSLIDNAAGGRAMDFSLAADDPRLTAKIIAKGVEALGVAPRGAVALSYQAMDLTVPGLAEAVRGGGRIAVEFDEKGARTVQSRADVSFIPGGPVRAALQPLGLGRELPVKLELTGSNSSLFKFDLDRSNPQPRAAFDVAAVLSSGATDVRIDARGWSDAPVGGAAAQDFNIDRLGLSAHGLELLGGKADASLALTDFKGPVAVAAGRLAAHMKAAGGPAKRLEARWGGDLRLDGLSLSLELSEGWVEADDVRAAGLQAAGVNRLSLAPKSESRSSAQQLNLVLGNGLTLTPDLALSLTLPRVLPVAAAPDTAPVALTLPRIGVSGYVTRSADAAPRGALKVAVADGRLAHPAAHLINIAGTLTSDGIHLAGPLAGQLAEAPDPARPRGLDRRGAILRSSINISHEDIDIKGIILSSGEVEVGTFDLRQRGDSAPVASLVVPPRSWTAEPAFLDVFGPIAGLTNTSGTFGLEVRAAPTKEALGGALKLTFADFGFTAGAVTVQGLNSVLALDQIWPLHAAAPQRLSFARLIAGVPFTDGEFTLNLDGDGLARLSQANLKLAGGIVMGKGIAVPLDGGSRSFAMDVANVDLDRLVKSFATDGLAASGKLAGTLPIRVSNSRLFIDQAALTGRGGTIVYRPATPPAALAQGGGNILLQALANFQFDEVTAHINGDVAKDLRVGLALKGRNLDLYGGHSIEFNLNLDGPLNRLVRQGLSGYTVPEDIKQRLEQQGLSPAPN